MSKYVTVLIDTQHSASSSVHVNELVILLTLSPPSESLEDDEGEGLGSGSLIVR